MMATPQSRACLDMMATPQIRACLERVRWRITQYLSACAAWQAGCVRRCECWTGCGQMCLCWGLTPALPRALCSSPRMPGLLSGQKPSIWHASRDHVSASPRGCA